MNFRLYPAAPLPDSLWFGGHHGDGARPAETRRQSQCQEPVWGGPLDGVRDAEQFGLHQSSSRVRGNLIFA